MRSEKCKVLKWRSVRVQSPKAEVVRFSKLEGNSKHEI
jgi:hypothetical protein